MIRRRFPSLTILFIIGCFFSGCALKTEYFGGTQVQGSPGSVDWTDFDVILSRVVVNDKIDYDRLYGRRKRIDRLLERLSQVNPVSYPAVFPEHADELSYWINTYNAIVLRALIDLGQERVAPRTVPGNLNYLYGLRTAGGGTLSLAQLREHVLQSSGADWRPRLLLCTGRMDGPPMPRHAFWPSIMEAELDRAVSRAIKCEQVVKIDHGMKRLLLCNELYGIRDPLIEDYNRRLSTHSATLVNVLLEKSTRSRREILNSAIGYNVERMPADARICAVTAAQMDEKESE